MVFGDNPNTGFGAKKNPSNVSSSRPQLVRKGHVEEEVHNPAVISPVFFGKKKNLQRPRREVVFDESLVVWQRRCVVVMAIFANSAVIDIALIPYDTLYPMSCMNHRLRPYQINTLL
jgi:hypothetical protein